jgi:RNA polymerase sigma-70 factor (family 1)
MQNMMPEYSDEQLLLQMQYGDGQAFDLLYEKYWEKTFSDAYKRLRNREQSKDVVQDIFTDIWLRRDVIQITNLPGYLQVAVRNRVLKLLEKQKNSHPFFDAIENLPSLHHFADSNLLWKELAASYDALVATLPPKRQQIFKMRYQEDLTTTEIASTLRVSRKTVQNQLTRAIEQLKVSLSHIFLFLLLLGNIF